MSVLKDLVPTGTAWDTPGKAVAAARETMTQQHRADLERIVAELGLTRAGDYLASTIFEAGRRALTGNIVAAYPSRLARAVARMLERSLEAFAPLMAVNGDRVCVTRTADRDGWSLVTLELRRAK